MDIGVISLVSFSGRRERFSEAASKMKFRTWLTLAPPTFAFAPTLFSVELEGVSGLVPPLDAAAVLPRSAEASATVRLRRRTVPALSLGRTMRPRNQP